MPKRPNNRKRGYKAFDPYCTDKVRMALYKRPNGPHMGKLILGKTHLSGLDDKCFSRTGRIKKGYRNVPFNAEREFAIEKRQLEELNSMLHNKKSRQSYANSHNNRNNDNDDNGDDDKDDNGDKDDNTNQSDSETEAKLQNSDETMVETTSAAAKKKRKKQIGLCDRLTNESIPEFIRRVKRTENAALADLNRKEMEKRLRKKEKQQKKALSKQHGGVETETIKMDTTVYENSRQRRRAKQKQIRKEKLLMTKLEESSQPQKETIHFGETVDCPPQFQNCDFMKRSRNKKKRFLMQNFVSADRKVNVSGVSFADTIIKRAKELELERVKENYKKIKADRRQKELKRVWKAKKAKQKSKY